MQPIVDAINKKIVRGEEVSLAEHAVLHLHSESNQLNGKLDSVLEQQATILSQQKTILETFQQGAGALKLFKIIGAVVAPLAALAGLWHLAFGKVGG